MKRLLTLGALLLTPVLACAETGSTGIIKEIASYDAVSPAQEGYADRTDFSVGFYSSKGTKSLYSLNTIQPLYRSENFDHTVYGLAGLGIKKMHKDADIGLGVGYRYMTPCGCLLGAGLYFNDKQKEANKGRETAKAISFEWMTAYTTLNLGFYDKVGKNWNRTRDLVDLSKSKTMLDLSFQIPYLKWAQLNLGYKYKSLTNWKWNRLEYRVNMDLVGPLALQFGERKDVRRSKFVRFVVNFGRPAHREYTMAEGLIGEEAFTARDLRGYTLSPILRQRID